MDIKWIIGSSILFNCIIGSDIMRQRIKKNGFTLIELIVSIAIIGILLIAVLTSFAGDFVQVFSNGLRTKNVFQAQNKIDNLITDINDFGVDPQVNVQAYEIRIKLYSSDGKKSIESEIIRGNMIKVDMNDKSKVTLSTFVPNE